MFLNTGSPNNLYCTVIKYAFGRLARVVLEVFLLIFPFRVPLVYVRGFVRYPRRTCTYRFLFCVSFFLFFRTFLVFLTMIGILNRFQRQKASHLAFSAANFAQNTRLPATIAIAPQIGRRIKIRLCSDPIESPLNLTPLEIN